jgi:hypothetical protein
MEDSGIYVTEKIYSKIQKNLKYLNSGNKEI